MKRYIMHLSAEPFNLIKEGKKVVEVRLYDEKRFQSFGDLFLFVPKEYLAHESLSLREQIERMREYYSEEEEREYGVLGIWFEMVK